jgi:signal transduction histidine kinase
LALVVERQTEAIVSSENELRQARAIMLQKDQLAELGSLVGTLGHELATPMGIGITVVSSLHEHARQLTNSLLANSLTKQDLQAFLDSITENTILVQENLQRATELMGSFKQIAVDQAGGACRSFCVDEYLKTIARSLGPLLKRSPHEFCYSCIPDLWVEGFPGMLYQILVNLVNNALIHAFDGMPEGTKGRISADLSYEQGGLSIVVRDSGKGMDTEIASQVFTRYFTTRQGKGGSGLGLHIVESLVLEAGGTINMQTKPNEGTQFSIFLPWNQCQTP